MVARQIPRPADLRPLLRFKAPRLDRKAARLADMPIEQEREFKLPITGPLIPA